MHRTQISLEREQYEMLTREAARRGLSLSALLRELVVERYRRPGHSRRPAKDALSRVTGLAAGTGEAVGRSHNRFLYGRKRV